MAKVIVRIPNKEQYSYTELEFNSIEEYQKEYPRFAEVMVNSRLTFQQIEKKTEMEAAPF